MTRKPSPPPVTLLRVDLPADSGWSALAWSSFDATGKWVAHGEAAPEALPAHGKLEIVLPARRVSAHSVSLPAQEKKHLAALIALYGVVNLLAAVLPGYATLTGMRFLAGLPHGGYLGVAMLFAADALPRESRAKGVTQVLLGLTIANIAGVPLAGVLGQGLGWRWGFALPGVLALIAGWLMAKGRERS